MRGSGGYRITSQVPFVLPRRRSREAARPWTVAQTPVVLANSFEGGTNGVTITPANSGGASGDAFTAVTSTPVFSSAAAAHGALSARGTGSTKVLVWGDGTYSGIFSPVGVRYLYARSYHLVEAAFLSNGPLVNFEYGISDATAVKTNSDGTLVFSGHGLTNTTAVVTLGQWFRVEVFTDVGSARSELRLYLSMDSETPTETISHEGPITNKNLQSSINRVKFYASADATTSSHVDDIAASTVGWIGPFVAPPTFAPPPLPMRRRPSLAAWDVR